MPIITLPDGNNLDFPKKVTGLQIAEKISKSLAKQAMIISVNGELKDLNHVIENDCTVKIFTSKNDETPNLNFFLFGAVQIPQIVQAFSFFFFFANKRARNCVGSS